MAPTWIETDTNTNVNISSATAVGVYTSTGDKFVMPQLLADQVAGNGDYVYYVTLQVNGAGSAYVIGPKTTHTAAAGETAIGAQGGFIAVRSGDVVTVYIDGLAGDTAIPDVTVRWFELDASANVTMQQGVAVAAADANGNVPVIVKAWYDTLVPEPDTAGFPDVGTIRNIPDFVAQQVRDAMALARTVTSSVAPAGSIDAMIESLMGVAIGGHDHTVLTNAGDLSDLYDANAIDDQTGLPTTHDTGDSTVWFMQEFDGDLFVGYSKRPMNGVSGIIARIDSDGLHFEYDLPEEGAGRMLVTPDDASLIVLGVDERASSGASSLYLRDTAGTWTRKTTLTDMASHVTDGVFVGNRLYVSGQGRNYVAWTDDLGDTWEYGLPYVAGRATCIGAAGDSIYTVVAEYAAPASYTIWRSDDSGATWSDVKTYSHDGAIIDTTRVFFQMEPWRDRLITAYGANVLVEIQEDGTVTEFVTPFRLNQQKFETLLADGNWLYALSSDSVYRTLDLRKWERVFEFSGFTYPITGFGAIGRWDDNLVLSTFGDTAPAGTLAYLVQVPIDTFSSQAIADALLLAPTAGAPAAGSVYKHLDDLSAAGDPWSTALPGAYGAGTAGALLSGIDGNVDLLLAADTSTTDATAAGAISRRRGNSWAIPLTIGAITGYTSLWFTIKSSYDDADTSALVQVKLNSPSALDGLLYVNGTTASSAALGSITVSDATTGAIVIAVDETITDDLAPGEYCYDVQTLIAGDVATPDSGTFTVTADVTRSVT